MLLDLLIFSKTGAPKLFLGFGIVSRDYNTTAIKIKFPAVGLNRPLGIRKIKASGFSRLSAL
jgi:hypothetical protein